MIRWRNVVHHLRGSWKRHLGTALMVLGVFVAVQAWQTRDVPAGQIPDLALTLLQPDGSTTDTTLTAWRAAHPGQPVALHVWAEWCPICRAEEGTVTSLAQDHPVLTIAMQSGPPAVVSRVLRLRQLPWVTAVDPHNEATHTLGFKAVPAFVVIDARGRLRAASVGYTTEPSMRARLWWARLTG